MTRRTDAAAFLLHFTPYRETSLVVDLFTREHGRIAAVAKGAKRPRSALRAVLLQFQPLTVSWTGRGELRTLTGAEWAGGLIAPRGDALLCAFYLNELIVRLLAREDPHPVLFDGYAEALRALSERAPLDDTLRRFEWLLLRETGYAPDLAHDAQQRPIERARSYAWQAGSGFVATDAAPGSGTTTSGTMTSGTTTSRTTASGTTGSGTTTSGTTTSGTTTSGSKVSGTTVSGTTVSGTTVSGTTVSGETLGDLAAGRFDSVASRSQAKYLTRAILAHHLEGSVLNTRQILIDLQKL